MSKGSSNKGPVRDWLSKPVKFPNSQATKKSTATVQPVKLPNSQTLKKPTATVQPVKLSNSQTSKKPTVNVQPIKKPTVNVQYNHPHIHNQPQQSYVKPTPTVGSQKISGNNHHAIQIPTNSGIKGNIASNNSVQININVHKNHHQGNSQRKPTSVYNPPKPQGPRKVHVQTSGGINNNVAFQNSVQINVNVSSNVKNAKPRSNKTQHVHNYIKPKPQCTAGVNNCDGHKRNGIQGTRIKRILGGSTINIEAVPYMLSMRLNDKHICGAVIIGETWGLTAAHCCINTGKNSADSFYVHSGTSNLYSGGNLHKITRMVRHERYVLDLNDDYDICAVQVNPPFEYSNLIAAVKLPDPSVPFDDSRGLVTGWGYTEADGQVLSPVLKSLAVRRVDLERCKYMYRNLYTIHDRDVCYVSENDSGDACQGDSGGPLVNDDFILLGIVSFGDECGYSTLPGVYTDTLQFRNWIKNKTNI